jgi:ribosomal protein S27AE
MQDHWRHGPCPVCGADDWLAEGRLFLVQRSAVSEDTEGLARPQFPVHCKACGYTVWVNARRAGLFDSPVPDDLAGLTPGSAGGPGGPAGSPTDHGPG